MENLALFDGEVSGPARTIKNVKRDRKAEKKLQARVEKVHNKPFKNNSKEIDSRGSSY